VPQYCASGSGILSLGEGTRNRAGKYFAVAPQAKARREAGLSVFRDAGSISVSQPAA
jgi:hypothetical protein